MGFVHLHVHSEYSLLDGACTISKMMPLLKEMGQDSVAVTDHGNMYGTIKFYKAAKKAGIKPIIGCEVYTAARTRFDRTRELDGSSGHLVLLCENNIGYSNLIKLVSLSNLEGYYYKPRVDRELLEKYHEGLICLSACLAGDIPQHLLAGDYDGAKELALWYWNVFGKDRYYLEIQDHGIPEQKEVIDGIVRLSRETGIPMVCTNDAHYLTKNDAKAQKVLVYVQIKKTISEESGMGFDTDEFYLKSEKEMRDLFEYIPEACDNTVKIASMCDVSFSNLDDPDHRVYHLPDFRLPDGKDHYEFLRELAYEGFEKRYNGKHPEYKERLEYELGVVNKMGFVDYFLIVSDYVRFAKRTGIPVGPGRGSGAGSIVAYCIEITNIDPIKYNLLFERFLNPERVSMPDFDVDFCVERRQEVVDYCINKYGKECVAQIVTFGTMKAKMAVKDVARVLEFTPQEANSIAKLLQDKITIKESIELIPELKALYESDTRIRELLDTSSSIENSPRHTSVHACGVVITNGAVSNFVPLGIEDEMPVTQFDMIVDEELGLLKMDFLGLRNLTVIEDACSQIRKKNPEFNIEKVDMDDKAVYDMLSLGQTDGVFQLESGGMKRTLIQLKPKNIEDITAVISLYRPGPMDSIPTYIEYSNHPERIKYATPELESILSVTHGCMVYQEQVMEIVRKLGGFSLGRADIVRKAMGKKKMDVMQREREFFVHGKIKDNGEVEIPGAIKNGISESVANKIYDDMIEFAKYAFNKSHAAAYAFVTYYTAYLKCFYMKEYMSALLTSVLGKTDKMVGYINEAKKQNVPVLAPDINESEVNFSVSGENIRFGLVAVKNVGTNVAHDIITEREKNGAFESFYSFVERMLKGYEMDSRTVESLIYSGAFDSFGQSRHQLIVAYPDIKSGILAKIKEEAFGQMSLFGDEPEVIEYKYPNVPEFSKKEKLLHEKEVAGLYISDHPLKQYTNVPEASDCTLISELEDEDGGYDNNSQVRIMGILAKVNKKLTKNKTMMAVLSVQDLTGTIEVLLFARSYDKFSSLLEEDRVCIIGGKLSIEEDVGSDEDAESVRTARIICNDIVDVTSRGNSEYNSVETITEEKPLAMMITVRDCDKMLFDECVSILKTHSGKSSVYFNFSDMGKKARYDYGVTISEELITRLSVLFGEDRILVKEVAK